eukprot:m.68323 g.68323  ORF g.68323 m.68323 type:complete len:201 (-) comp9914_c0_seq1:62-664(-)
MRWMENPWFLFSCQTPLRIRVALVTSSRNQQFSTLTLCFRLRVTILACILPIGDHPRSLSTTTMLTTPSVLEIAPLHGAAAVGIHTKTHPAVISLQNKMIIAGGNCNTDCYPTESLANNFIVLRSMTDSTFGDTMYAEFQTGNLNSGPISFESPDFYELYDASTDPWMMNNIYNNTDVAKIKAMHDTLHAFASCSGDTCP